MLISLLCLLLLSPVLSSYQLLSPTHTSLFSGSNPTLILGTSDLLAMSPPSASYSLLTWVKFTSAPGTAFSFLSIVKSGVAVLSVAKLVNGAVEATARDALWGVATCQVGGSVGPVWSHVAVMVASSTTNVLTLVVTQWLGAASIATSLSPLPFSVYDPSTSTLYVAGPTSSLSLTVTHYTGLHVGCSVRSDKPNTCQHSHYCISSYL